MSPRSLEAIMLCNYRQSCAGQILSNLTCCSTNPSQMEMPHLQGHKYKENTLRSVSTLFRVPSRDLFSRHCILVLVFLEGATFFTQYRRFHNICQNIYCRHSDIGSGVPTRTIVITDFRSSLFLHSLYIYCF